MTMTALCLLVAIALCCLALKRRVAAGTLLAVSLALFVAIGCGLLPAWLLQRLQSEFEAKPAIQWSGRNAIVLLGGGIEKRGTVEPGLFSYSRIVEAAKLHRQCRTANADCKILISGGAPEQAGSSEAEVYLGVLSQLGIETADIIPETKSRNTFQNAQFTSAILAERQVDRVFLVSSGFHLKRSVLYFRHFGVSASPVRSDFLSAKPAILPLAYNFAVTDFAIHEYIGIARFHAYNALGWNPPPRSPATQAIGSAAS
jgi:uncharacterized SAM-binding protein YcdF (DUF218 family)